MDEIKKDLMDRIRKLEDWQKSMILWDFLYEANEEQTDYISKEITEYEQINKELEASKEV